MAPSNATAPHEGFHILPFTPVAASNIVRRFKESDHTLAIITTVLGTATLVSLITIFFLRRRLNRTNSIIANFQPADRTARSPDDIEASALDRSEIARQTRSRGCAPNVSSPLREAEKPPRLPELELPRTVKDLRNLGRETRLAWKAEALEVRETADIGSERLSTYPDEAAPYGRSLTGRPRRSVAC